MDAVNAHTHAIPHYIYPKADDVFARAAEITWHQDEPFGSTSIFAQWCVFKEAHRAGIKVVLDGQGADEQLAGYHSSFFYYLSDLARRGRWIELVRTIGARKRVHGTAIGVQFQQHIQPLLPPRLARLLRAEPQTDQQDNWLDSEPLRSHAQRPGALQLATDLLDLPQLTDIDSLCCTLTFASNLQMLLHWEDRKSMAHSIEARVPFVDHPLVEFSLGLGNDHKLVGAQTKRVLRRAMHGVLPDVVRKRVDKLGFTTPEAAWFRGPLRNLVMEGVGATLRRYPGLLNAAGVRTLAADMLNGKKPVDFRLWRIISLGLWGERFAVAL